MYDDFANPWNIRLKWLYLLGVVFALLMPVFYTIYISFNQHGFGARIYEFTFDWYRVVLGDTLLVISLKWTVYLALAAIAVTIPMALLSAKFYKRTRRKVAFVALMLSPLFDGWFDLGFLTALIGQVIYVHPYAFIVILITMSRYRVQQTEAARGCGATAWQAFWQVEFPQIRVGVFSSCAFVTILSFNEAVRTALLKGGFDTFSNVLVAQMLNIGMSGESYAMAGIMSIVSMLVIGSVIVFTLLRTERLERRARAMAQPVMSS